MTRYEKRMICPICSRRHVVRLSSLYSPTVEVYCKKKKKMQWWNIEKRKRL